MLRSSKTLDRLKAIDDAADGLLAEREVRAELHPIHVEVLELVDGLMADIGRGAQHDREVSVMLRVFRSARPRLERQLSQVDPEMIVLWMADLGRRFGSVGANRPQALPAVPTAEPVAQADAEAGPAT